MNIVDQGFGDGFPLDASRVGNPMWTHASTVPGVASGGGGGGGGGSRGSSGGAGGGSKDAGELPSGEHTGQSVVDRQINNMLTLRANANKSSRSVQLPMHSFGETTL